MKKTSKHLFTHIVLPFLALAVIIVGIYLYLFAPKAYDDCIPDEAKAVIQIDAQKCKEEISSLAAYWGIRPNGINLKKPLYAFITPNEYIGLVAEVSNEQEIALNVQRLFKEHKCMAPQKAGGLMWAWLNEGWQLAWNSHTLMILGPGTIQEQDMLTQTISKLFDFHRSESFMHTEKYSMLEKQKGDLKLYSALDALPTPFNLIFRLDVPTNIDPASCNLYAGMKLGKETKLEGKITGDEEETNAELEDYEQHNPPISKVFPNYISEYTLFTLVSRSKENHLFELLRQDDTFNQLLQGLNRTIDANNMLQNINGNVTLLITHLDKEKTPTFSLQAETSDKDLMVNAPSWFEKAKQQKDVSLTKRGNEYILKSKEKELFFGQKNKIIFFRDQDTGDADKGKNITKDAIGCRQYFRLNLKKFIQQPCFSEATKVLFTTIFKNHTTMTYKAKAGRKVTLEIK